MPMKFKPVSLLALVLLAVVLVSGCTGLGGTVTAGNGVVILNFEPDLIGTYDSGDPVKLLLRIQNQGEVRATDVKAELAGIDTTEWAAFGATFYKTIADMTPYDAVTNTQGAEKTVTWDLQAPELERGIDLVYEPIAKVSYNYKTTAQKPITIVAEDELRRIQQQGGSLPSKITVYTGGPLSVTVETKDYVKTTQEFGSYDIFPISIVITNNYGGTIIPDTLGGFGVLGEEYLYPVQVRITPPSGTDFVHSGFFGDDDCTTGTIIKDLWKGQNAKITCELMVISPPTYRQERHLKVELEYRYQTEAITQIPVRGIREAGTFF